MLGVDPRAFRITWTIFLFALLLGTLYAIRDTLLLFAVSIFFAYMLAPLVELAERMTLKHRGIALAIVFVVLVGALVALGITLGSRIIDQASSLFSKLPDLIGHDRLQSLPLPYWLEPLRERIVAALQAEAATLQQSIVPLLQQAGGHILSGISVIVPVILVPVFSFFWLKDARDIRSSILEGFEGRERSLLSRVLADIDLVLSKYIRALVILALFSFGAWAIFLYATGAPYQLLLAGISGILEFIPFIGPLTSLIVVLLVSAISGHSGLLWIAVFWAGLRMFQDYVLNPILMSAGIELHPLLVLFGVLAGEQIGGIPGMFFSVPAIAILKVVFIRLRERHMRRTLAPNTPA